MSVRKGLTHPLVKFFCNSCCLSHIIIKVASPPETFEFEFDLFPPPSQGHIPENSAAGTVVLLAKPIVAVDPDRLDKDSVALQLYGKDSDKFKLNSRTGEVVLAAEPLDREEKEVYYLRLRATDTAGQQGEGQLVIHVTDRNDHQPKFLKLQVLDSRLVSVAADKVWVGSGVGAPVLDMAETVPPGTRIARVLAEDLDNSRTAQLLYSLLSEEGTYQVLRSFSEVTKVL